MNEPNQAPRWIAGIEPPKELLTATGTQILEFECREQPARLAELIQSYANDAEIRAQLKQFERLAERKGPALFVGMGASYCSAISGAVLLETQGRYSAAVDAGEWLHYGRPVWDAPSLSILLTTSGESAELVALFKADGESPLGLICNNPASTCWGPVSYTHLVGRRGQKEFRSIPVHGHREDRRNLRRIDPRVLAGEYCASFRKPSTY